MILRKPVYWNEVLKAVRNVEPKLWEKMKKAGEERLRGNILFGGYHLKNEGVKEYPLSIEIKASLELPERPGSDSRLVDKLIVDSANECCNGTTDNRLSLRVFIIPRCPMMQSIRETDRVFGRNPEIPYEIRYSIKPDYSKFTDS